MSLRFRLSILVGIAVLPPLLLTAYNTLQWQDFLERDAREEALAAARLLSAEFNQLAEGSRNVMIAMGKHPAVPDREEECSAYFRSVVAALPIYRQAAVIDPQGKFHCSTIPIPPNLDVSDRLYFRGPLATGQLTIGTLTQGRVTKENSIHISMPYRPPGAASDWVIVLILNPDRVADEVAARPFTRHRIFVLDRGGSVVLTLPKEGAPGDQGARLLAQAIFSGAGNRPAGTLEVRDAQGHPQLVGFVPTDDPPRGLFIAVAIDRTVAISEATVTARRSIVIGPLVLLLAIGGAFFATHVLIRRPVLALVETARRREMGEIGAQFPPLTNEGELGELSAALSRMSSKIDELLEQKSFLLRELQHRVMNSLHLLSSMLSLQTRHLSEPVAREQLARARDRILSMATVYRHLYQADTVGNIEVREFLQTICDETERAYAGASALTIELDADPLLVTGGDATSLAVLTYELITNALKHAYPEGEGGPVSISFKRLADASYELRVRDRGRGLPSDFSLDQAKSLGLKVIAGSARQLGGTVEIIRRDAGTEFAVRLPPSLGTAQGRVA
jgi:two-component sensor histidine kinase